MTIIKLVFKIPTPFLNRYSDAGIAFSLRKLNNNYNGPALRINQNGNESDIGFNSQGELDTTLTNVPVVTWYDQSGNNYHATQYDYVSRRPKLIKINNKYTLSFDQSWFLIREIDYSKIASNDSQNSIFIVCQLDPIPQALIGNNLERNSQILILRWEDNQTYYEIGNTQESSFVEIDYSKFSVFSFLKSTQNSLLLKNNSTLKTTPNISTFTPITQNLYIGAKYEDGLAIKGIMSEFIVYNKFLPNYLEAISDINSYYKTY